VEGFTDMKEGDITNNYEKENIEEVKEENIKV
jgi:hypothetical protein